MKKETMITLQELQYAVKNVGSFDFGDFNFDTIQGALNYIEELEKENKKLIDVRKWYFENTVSKAVSPEMLHKILRQDYIPKQKIRDKIEELEEEDLEIYDTDSEDLIIAKYEQRAVLDFAQQLLNDKEEK